jgi:hypothetical protein
VQNTSEHATKHAHGAEGRLSWARLLKRVFDIDIEHSPNCGSALKIIAAPSTSSGQALKNRRRSPRSSRIWAYLRAPPRPPPARPLALFQAA